MVVRQNITAARRVYSGDECAICAERRHLIAMDGDVDMRRRRQSAIVSDRIIERFRERVTGSERQNLSVAGIDLMNPLIFRGLIMA